MATIGSLANGLAFGRMPGPGWRPGTLPQPINGGKGIVLPGVGAEKGGMQQPPPLFPGLPGGYTTGMGLGTIKPLPGPGWQPGTQPLNPGKGYGVPAPIDYGRGGPMQPLPRYPVIPQPLPSYATGTPLVTGDQVAQLHDGEAVIPAAQNPANTTLGGLAALPSDLATTNPQLAAFLARTRDPNYQNTQANENRLGAAGWNAWDPYGGAGALDANGQPVRSLAQQQGLTIPTGPVGNTESNAGIWDSVNAAPAAAATGITDMRGGGRGASVAGTATPSATVGNMASGTVPGVNEAAGNYTGGMSMSDYLNPMADYATAEGLKGVQSTFAGNGMLNSGSALKGITDYAGKMAINNNWQPAFTNYMADKNFNLGVDTGDRAFNYQAALNDQTIPFSQQLQLAQLGLSGTQGQAGTNNLLATLLSQNALASGQTGASGTIGGSNAVNNAISQMLQQYLGNNYMQILQGLGTGTGR